MAVVVCLFGVLTNVANIIVLTRKNMLSSTNTILLWLAVADLLTMADYIPFAIYFYIMKEPSLPSFATTEYPWIIWLLFHASFAIVCHSIAIWLTIALAIFRYIYICKPTQSAIYCSQQRARYVVVAVVVFAVIVLIPNCVVNTVGYQHGTNVTKTVAATMSSPVVKPVNGTVQVPYDTLETPAALTSPSRGFYYPDYYPSHALQNFNYWTQAIIIKLVPCGMLTTLTLLLLHAMHQAYQKRLKLKAQSRKSDSDKSGEQNRVTVMLLMVVVLFTITELPQGILTLMNIFIPCFNLVVYNQLGDVVDMMALINNSVNFVLYCTMSTQFRTTFVSVFCPAKPKRPKWFKLKLLNRKGDKSPSIEVTSPNNNEAAPPISSDVKTTTLTTCNELGHDSNVPRDVAHNQATVDQSSANHDQGDGDRLLPQQAIANGTRGSGETLLRNDNIDDPRIAILTDQDVNASAV